MRIAIRPTSTSAGFDGLFMSPWRVWLPIQRCMQDRAEKERRECSQGQWLWRRRSASRLSGLYRRYIVHFCLPAHIVLTARQDIFGGG